MKYLVYICGDYLSCLSAQIALSCFAHSCSVQSAASILLITLIAIH